MKKMKALVALTLICLMALTGCSSIVDKVVDGMDEAIKNEQNDPPKDPTPEQNPPAQNPPDDPGKQPEDPGKQPENPPVDPNPGQSVLDPDLQIFQQEGTVNPLTGLAGIREEALSRIPVAVMIGNSRDALPQWGVSKADILVEMLVEGAITRMMGIYKDPYEVEAIASVRSARPYFMDIAQSFGAAYLHFGGSTTAYEAIDQRADLLNFDGLKGWEGSLFYRDSSRRATVGSVHSVTTTGKLIETALLTSQKEITLAGDQPSAFLFSDKVSNKSAAAAGAEAGKVTLNYSNSNKPYFTYDAASGNYLRYEYNAAHMDGYTNQQIAVKNLLVLRMQTANVPGDSLGIIDIQTTGSGDGYYFCDGKYISITWSKDSYNGALQLFDMDGNPLLMARGNTFMSVVKTTTNVSIQ